MPRKKADYTPLEGFPVETPFSSIDEIEEYLSGNLIQCLECGHSFRALARHLRDHGMTVDEYREKHGIPWTRGLICKQLKESLSEYAKSSGSASHFGDKGGGIKKGDSLHQRPYCKARRIEKMTYTDEDYYRVAKRVASGEALLSVCKEDGTPSTMAVKEYRIFNREFDAFWRKEVEPKMMNIRMSARKSLSSGRVFLAKAMISDGYPSQVISKATGYSEEMVLRIKRGDSWALSGEDQKRTPND